MASPSGATLSDTFAGLQTMFLPDYPAIGATARDSAHKSFSGTDRRRTPAECDRARGCAAADRPGCVSCARCLADVLSEPAQRRDPVCPGFQNGGRFPAQRPDCSRRTRSRSWRPTRFTKSSRGRRWNLPMTTRSALRKKQSARHGMKRSLPLSIAAQNARGRRRCSQAASPDVRRRPPAKPGRWGIFGGSRKLCL